MKDMDDTVIITLTREELYDQVWSTPMMHLAKKYYLSDVGLAKVCRKHQIPYPPRGYWAKKRQGKIVRKPRLPVCNDPKLQIISIVKKDTSEEKPPSPQTSELDFDADVLETLAAARALGKVKIAADLRGLHTLVRNTKEGLEVAKPDKNNLLSARDPGLRTEADGKTTLFKQLLFGKEHRELLFQ